MPRFVRTADGNIRAARVNGPFPGSHLKSVQLGRRFDAVLAGARG
jgi:hypothetical protein